MFIYVLGVSNVFYGLYQEEELYWCHSGNIYIITAAEQTVECRKVKNYIKVRNKLKKETYLHYQSYLNIYSVKCLLKCLIFFIEKGSSKRST